jgi:O-antigen/teichoic acid export membrane protein
MSADPSTPLEPTIESPTEAPPPETGVHPAAPSAELHGKVLRGSAWTLAGIGGSRVIRLANNLILTRLMLTPDPIGIMTMANTLLLGLQMFSDIGIRPAIIQSKRGDDPAFLNTAWTMAVIRGVILWLVACALAWPYAWFYGQSAGILLYIIPVVGATTVLQGFNSTSLVTANRKLALGRLTLIELAAQAISAATALVFAYFQPTPWALVAGAFSNAICYLVMGFVFLPGVKHRFHWEKEAARELVTFGKWIFLSTAITFLAMQCDPLVLGRIAGTSGAAAVAVYGIGKMWGQMPAEVFQQLLGRVFFPVISGMMHSGTFDPVKIKDLRTRLLLPVALGSGAVFVAAEPAIRIMYRHDYWGAGPVFAITAAGAWMGTLAHTYGYILLAAGKTKNLSVSTGLKTIIFFALVFPMFSRWGVPGIAIAVAAGEVGALIPMLHGARRLKVSMIDREIILTTVGLAFAGAMYGLQHGVFLATGSITVAVAANAVVTGAACLWCVRMLFGQLKRLT